MRKKYNFINKVIELKSNYVKHKLANLISINRIVTIHHYEFGKNFNFEGEMHDFWEMVYVDKGIVNIRAGSREFSLMAGEVIFHKPNEFHTIATDGKNVADVFVISFVCSSSGMGFFKGRVAKVPPKLRKNISGIIEESERTFDLMPMTGVALKLKPNAPIGGQQMIRIHLEEFLIKLVREESRVENTGIFPTKESMENHLVTQMAEIAERHIYDKVSVFAICAELNYSRSYLSGIFKAATGQTLLQYIIGLKIREAKRLIRENNLSISAISDKLCFDNPHYFSTVFKRATNFTPTQYKNSVL